MRRKKDILVQVNYSNDEKKLKELEDIKARIIIRILKEKYEKKILEQYIDNMRENS